MIELVNAELIDGPLDGWTGKVYFLPVITVAVPVVLSPSFKQFAAQPLPEPLKTTQYRFVRFSNSKALYKHLS